MLDDLDRITPVLLLVGVAASVLIWDSLPSGRLPAPRGKALQAFALLGPAGAAIWTLSLLLREAEGFAFAHSAVLDDLTFFFFFLFCGVVAALILAAEDQAERLGKYAAESYALLLMATAAMLLLSASRDLILIFVAIEMTSITQYVLAALRKDERAIEAGVKYLLLGAIASAVMLYGMALLFGLTGTTRLVAPEGELSIATAVAQRDVGLEAGLLLAVVMLVAGLAFKMAVVPFQMWAPDVYEGATAPVAAFLSVASKATAFVVVLRIFMEGLPDSSISADWSLIFAIVAAISMTLGNLVALGQNNIKRLLGYSSIAQAGYIMVGLAAVSADEGLSLGGSAVIFFIGSYAFTNLAAFLVVIALSSKPEDDSIGSYAGLFQRSPVLAAGLALALISLTGIPPTAGFVAKIYVFNAAVESDLIWLVVIAVLNSVVSAFYYLRITGLLFRGEPDSQEPVRAPAGLLVSLALAAGGILFVGIAPSPLLDAAKDAADILVQ